METTLVDSEERKSERVEVEMSSPKKHVVIDDRDLDLQIIRTESEPIEN